MSEALKASVARSHLTASDSGAVIGRFDQRIS